MVDLPPRGLVPTYNTNPYRSYVWDETSDGSSSILFDEHFRPGLLCGIALERVGTRLLHGSKKAILLVKLWMFEQVMDSRYNTRVTRLARKRLGVRGLGLIMQECVDLLRHVPQLFRVRSPKY